MDGGGVEMASQDVSFLFNTVRTTQRCFPAVLLAARGPPLLEKAFRGFFAAEQKDFRALVYFYSLVPIVM